jgi:DNA-binding protein WhiA
LRGAFLGAGSISLGRSPQIELRTASFEPAALLARLADAEGIALALAERDTHAVAYAKSWEAIESLLAVMGATETVRNWEELRQRREVRATANRLVNFDDANLRRSAQAAVAACARVERAMELLGNDIPEHLRYAGELRLAHRDASLDELGHHADPPMTKDAVAGRIRRLLAMADKRAAELGVPGTEASLPADLDDV